MDLVSPATMRILHVSEVHWGGVVSLLRHFTETQVKRGHQVHVLAPPQLPALSATRHDWSLDRHSPGTFPTALGELRRAVAAVKPDVIHLHSFMAGLFSRLPGVIPRSRFAIVYQPHAWAFDLYDDRLRVSAITLWERAANARTAAIVVNCEDEVQQGRRAGIDNDAFPVGVAVDLGHFVPPSEVVRVESRHALGISAPRAIVVMGRIAHQKGQDLLVAEWERRPVPDTDLLLVGPGDGSALAGLAPREWGRSVHAVGETADVRRWFWASDLLVMPSRYEAVSLVIGEALACGVPVVTTAVNGAREAVLDGPLAPAGAVVAVGDMQGLLDAARHRLDDESARRLESVHARRRAESLFDPTLVTENLEMAYQVARAKRTRS